MDTSTGAATAIGIPRDSWVTIPGYGYDQINSALYFGGPELLGEPSRTWSGCSPTTSSSPLRVLRGHDQGHRPDQVDNPVAFSRRPHQAQGFKAGQIVLGATTPWRSPGSGKPDRRRLRPLGQPAARAPRHPGQGPGERGRAGLHREGRALGDSNLRTNLPPDELFRLAQVVAQVDPSKITTCVVQGGIGSIGGASVVHPLVSQAKRLGNDARKDATIKHC